MQKSRKMLTLFLVVISIFVSTAMSVNAGSNTYYLSDSDTSPIRNGSGTSYNCSLNMKSTVTGGGGATAASGYSVSSKGTLTGSYPGFNPSYCEKIKYENTYKFSVIGSISLSVGTSGGNVSGGTSSSSRTVSETYTKASYPSLYRLNETISCKAQCFCIYWHYQNASATYTIKVNGNPVSSGVSTAANTVIW